MRIIKGIAASQGYAIGKIKKMGSSTVQINSERIETNEQEMKRFRSALSRAKNDLVELKNKTAKEIDEEHAMIFDAHIQILEDPEIDRMTLEAMETNQLSIEKNYFDVTNQFIAMFENMDDEYLKERASDIKDVQSRVLRYLTGANSDSTSLLTEDVIIVAEDLTPSDTASLDKKRVIAFITNVGGRTSHSAIMARSLEIPAVVGLKDIYEQGIEGEIAVVDGVIGEVVLSPDKDTLKHYKRLKSEFDEKKMLLKKLKNEKTSTTDNHLVELAANIGSPDDIDNAINNGAEGIGLYRTEFLYMQRDQLPSEEEQFEAYKKALVAFPNHKVVIRTLDIGGDKELSYLKFKKEMNPFLGFRAIRLCLEETDIFKTQLRALLRASAYGNLCIMFPMIATLDEVRQAKKILNEVDQELKQNNIKIGSYKVGIMVEIPSVAILADRFAKEVDFFSIGTNDLIQYSFAADRMNEKVAYLYQPYNPSLHRLIKNVIDAAHKENIWVGMCGEVAGDDYASIMLLGLGLDEFSMSAQGILDIRNNFRRLSYQKTKERMIPLLNLDTNSEVFEEIQKYANENLNK